MRLSTILPLAVCLVIPGFSAHATPQQQAPERPSAMERKDHPFRSRPAVLVTPAVTVTRGPFTSVQVNVDLDGNNIVGDAANEPSIAVDPREPARIAIGWRQFDTIASNFRQAGWAYSHDSGARWRFPGSLEPGIFRSDPVLETDRNGRFLYYSFTDDFTCDMWLSDFAAVSWLPPVAAFGGDKAWIVADKTLNVPGSDNVYAVWSPNVGCCGVDTFTRSVDGGFTWLKPIQVPSRVRWGNLVVDRHSNVYVAGIRGDVVDYGSTMVIKSFDARNPSSAPTFPQSVFVDLGGPLQYMAGPNPSGLLGQVWVAADPASDTVYLLASVDPPGPDPLDVRFARSDDGGATWSASVRVNDDASGTNAWQWFATMSVAPNGRLDAIWNDTRNDPSATFSELYYSVSFDGGGHWSTNVAVSPPFNHFVGYPQQNKIGDYDTTVSDDVGVHVAYVATFNGEQDVYHLRIGMRDCNGNGVADHDDITQGTSQDDNGDGVPDECQNLILSKLNPGLAGATNRISLTRATPHAPVTFVYGTVGADVPIGSCPGARLGILDLHVLGTFTADATGHIELSAAVGSSHHGESFLIQAIEGATCRSSNTVSHMFP